MERNAVHGVNGAAGRNLNELPSWPRRSEGKNSATSRQPVWPKSVTYVAGTFCYLCVRVGQQKMGIVAPRRANFPQRTASQCLHLVVYCYFPRLSPQPANTSIRFLLSLICHSVDVTSRKKSHWRDTFLRHPVLLDKCPLNFCVGGQNQAFRIRVFT